MYYDYHYEFLNLEDVNEKLFNMFKDHLDEEDFQKFESIVEEYASITAESIVCDMRKYCHKSDTRMDGNFANIREDWEITPDFVGSEIQTWGKFDDVVKSIDEKTISDEDLQKFQTWCWDWFIRAFGTWGLFYNFDTFIAECEYEEEQEEIPA